MLQKVIDTLLGVPPAVALLIIAGLVFGEAALFFGFVLPGETAVVYGGVLADAGKVSVVLVLAVVFFSWTRSEERANRAVDRTYERAALANALGNGLMPGEVARILAGRRVAEAFPIRWGESPEAYASRAVSEMFVAYLQ